MAKNKKVVARKTISKEETKSFFGKLKFTDSYTSLILGAIVVLVVGILFFTFSRINKNTDTSSTNDGSEASTEDTLSTYTIKPGDDLWSISESVYKDGYKWVEIAKLNKLENPDIIHVGNKLTLAPVTEVKPTVQEVQPATSVMEKNTIAGDSYAVKQGDFLWDIAVRAYGDGYKWVEIAKANNLDNPDIIHNGNTLKLPR